MVTGRGGVAAGMADGRAGRWPPGLGFVRVMGLSVPGCGGVLPHRASLRSHQPGSPWCRGARPGSRQRATELVQGAAGLPMVSGELGSASVRARPASGGKPRGQRAPRARSSCGRRAGHGAAAAGAGISPAAMRASQAWPVVITAHSQRSKAAAHAVRACPSASRLASRPVRCACLAARTLLWRSAPQTARQAAARSAGGPGARSGSAR